ncbi:MAG TPA: LptA/OstA family protein [Candidatus Dormibacteraeota bacterium]|nr:LptA/OstA family protein [Candidatus Dormibacteraeota bacterium]
MRTSQAARYARWSASAAFCLTAIVAGAYLYRGWQVRQVRKHAPPPAPLAVQRQSSTFSFSKVEGQQTIFTVTALRATEFKESDRNILEDVLIIISGRSGDRNDRIHTKSCEYRRDNGGVVCAGEVQMDLQSAEDAQRQSEATGRKPADGIIHLDTRNVTFNRENGEAQTDQDVNIEFPQGMARGTGVSYHSVSGIVHLQKNVEITLTSMPQGKAGAKQSSHTERNTSPLKVTGSKMEFMREAGLARLYGPVHATQAARELKAGMLELELDAMLHTRKLSALSAGSPGQRPELVSKEKDTSGTMTADELNVLLHPQGGIDKVQARGMVHGRMVGPKDEQQLDAGRVELDVGPKTRKPEQLQASGKVLAEMKAVANGGVKRLQTDALLVRFASSGTRSRTRIDRAETLSPGTLEWQGPTRPKAESTRLSGGKIIAKFNPNGQPAELSSQGGAEVERHLQDRPVQTTSSKELHVTFETGGEWSEMNFEGDVKLREGERSAQANQAQLLRSTQTSVLTGNAVVTDGMTRTTAERISFAQKTGEIRGDGDVASTDLAAGRGVVNLAPVPANITADHLTGNSVAGRALYSGKARLWQGDSVMEADSIELQRDTRKLLAVGNVLAEFPQAPGTITPLPATANPRSPKHPSVPGSTKRWRVHAGMLTYWGREGRARLEKNVDAKSQQEEIIAPVMEFYFPSAEAAGGARQLSRAVATGGVTVQEGERRGTADQGEYIASEGKFVLSGGHPTITGAFGDTTTGRKLTFFLADDTIVVDSEHGTRTLTKHRVEK